MLEAYFSESFILKKLLCLIFEIWLSYIWILRWLRRSSPFLRFLLSITSVILLEKIIMFNWIFILKLALIMKILLLRCCSNLLMNIFSSSRIRIRILNFFHRTSWWSFLWLILINLLLNSYWYLFFFKSSSLFYNLKKLFYRSFFFWFF